MRFSSGYRLRRRLTTLFKRLKFRTSIRRRFRNSSKPGRLSCWFQRARFTFRRALASTGFGSEYIRLRHDYQNPNPAPKGYLAVYVGPRSNEVNGEWDWERVLLPVMEFNHPLFGELLKAAEAEFGFEHPGGITIPCRISEFESVRTRIESGRAGLGGRRLMRWRREKKWGCFLYKLKSLGV